MVPITIDISGMISKFELTQSEIRDFSKLALDKLAQRYMYLWERNVNELHGTRTFYKAGMSFRRIDDYTVIFELQGKGISKLGLMLEQGANAFDIKEGFKKSQKAKNAGTEKWYLTVPFRLATPEALAEASIFAGKMPDPIYKIVKEKGKTDFNSLPKEFQSLGVRPELNVSETVLPKYKQEAYEHKSPIYEGIVKGEKKYHGQYNTFRRVSENSDYNSWIHKGFQPRNFMDKALVSLGSEIDGILSSARRDFLDKKFE